MSTALTFASPLLHPPPAPAAPLAQIPPPPGNALEIGGLSFHYYGLAIATGILIAIFVARRRYAAAGGDPDMVDRVAFVGLIAAFIGARFGYVVWRLDQFADRPLAVFAIWEGGLVLFGGLAGGIAAGYWVARRNRMDVPALADAVAPAIPLAQAVGRWGNYFNQELYGVATDLPWALEVEGPEGEVSLHHPTFLYESVLNVLLAIGLIVLGRARAIRRGALLWGYLAGYGIIRFSIELLRIDTDVRILGLSRNNWAFAGVALVGLVGLWWWHRRPEPAQRSTRSPSRKR